MFMLNMGMGSKQYTNDGLIITEGNIISITILVVIITAYVVIYTRVYCVLGIFGRQKVWQIAIHCLGI